MTESETAASRQRWSSAQAFVDAGLLTPETAAAKRPNRRGELTRERLIQAAVECFTEYGYSHTRVSDITHRAGTAQGNFYRHFTSLDDIFLAALAPSLDELARSSGGQDRGAGELEHLVASSTNYLITYSRHRHMLRLLREAAAVGTNEGFRTLWLRLRQEYVDRTRRWLSRLDAAGALRPGEDLEMLAEVLGCMTEQMAYVHIGMRSTTPRREDLDRLGRSLGTAWYRAVPRSDDGS